MRTVLVAALGLAAAGCSPASRTPLHPDRIVAEIPLEHADAREVAALLNQLMLDSERVASWRGCVLYEPGFEPVWTDPGPHYAALDRRTLAVLRWPQGEDLDRLRELLERMDVRGASDG